MTGNDIARDLLVRPKLVRGESVRSLLDRLVAYNRLPLTLFDGPGQVLTATHAVMELADSLGWARDELAKRATWAPAKATGNGLVSVGTSLLGKRCVIGQQRRICPHCIAVARWTPIDWELRINAACRHHRCMLLTKCSRCGAAFPWLTHDTVCGECGIRWSEMKAGVAPAWAIHLAHCLHSGIVRSLRGVHDDGRSKDGPARLRLEKYLVLLDVLRFEAMPQWLNTRMWETFNIQWSVQLLNDRDLRSWLWSKAFLHAAKDPMSLAKALLPTGSRMTIATYFAGFLPDAPVPRQIVTALKERDERVLLRRLSSRSRFDPRIHNVRGVIRVPASPPRSTPLLDDDDFYEVDDGMPRAVLEHGIREILDWTRMSQQDGRVLDEDGEDDEEDDEDELSGPVLAC